MPAFEKKAALGGQSRIHYTSVMYSLKLVAARQAVPSEKRAFPKPMDALPVIQ
jgi:hypothetical protein